MAESGPGVQLMPNSGQRARGIERLLPGDLVFFNAQPVPNRQIDHSGIYLGLDDAGLDVYAALGCPPTATRNIPHC
jgi:cell wall-associated NlpC family hydrolase